MAKLKYSDILKRDNFNHLVNLSDAYIDGILNKFKGNFKINEQIINIKTMKKIFEIGDFKTPIYMEFEDIGFVKLTKLDKLYPFSSSRKNPFSVEDAQYLKLKNQMTKIKQMKFNCNGEIFQIFGIRKTKGFKKSDFELLDEFEQPVVWISHKAGFSPRCFWHWGGVSKFKEHTEIKDFISSISEDSIIPGYFRTRKISDKHIKKASVYGDDFGGKFGENNVNIVAQGDLSFKKNGDVWIISGNNIHYNGDNIPDAYTPILTARYSGSRSDFGIKNIRIVVRPYDCRKNINNE